MDERLPDILHQSLDNENYDVPPEYFQDMQTEVISKWKGTKKSTPPIRLIMAVAACLTVLLISIFLFQEREAPSPVLAEIDEEILLEYLIEEGEIDDIIEVEGDDLASIDKVMNWY